MLSQISSGIFGVLWSSYAYPISCKEFGGSFVLSHVVIFSIINRTFFVCFETIIIGALALMPLPCLSKLGLPMSCAMYTTALKYSCCTWSFNTKYHLGCLNMRHCHFLYTKVLTLSHDSFLYQLKPFGR